jgi:hypothetical protein
MSKKNFFLFQRCTVFTIVPLMETNIYAKFQLFLIIFRGCSIEVKLHYIDAFATRLNFNGCNVQESIAGKKYVSNAHKLLSNS